VACIVFTVELMVGSLALKPDLSDRQYKVYPIKVDIVHAYFKIYNASADSGLRNNIMASYVLALNITNPTDMTLRLGEVFFLWRALLTSIELLAMAMKTTTFTLTPQDCSAELNSLFDLPMLIIAMLLR